MDPPPLIGPSSLRTHSFLAAEHTRYPTKIYAPYPSIPEETNGSQEYRGHPISERQFPEDRIQGQGIDHKLLMSRKRDSSGLSVDEGQRRQAHIDDLSGKVHVIDINDARCQVPLKHGKIALRNNMGFSRVDRNGETPELYYTSRPGHDRNQFLEDAPFIPNGEGQHSLASAVDMRNDGYLYPSLNHTGPSRPPLERRPTGDSPAIQTTTKKDTFSNLPEHGSFRRVQASEPLTQNGLMGYRSVSKPLVSTADRSSYRIRDDNTNVGPSKLLHIPRPSKILVAPDARDGREFSLHRPVPVHSVPIEQESPERRPVFLDQDTRPSRIYSHDFVRPVHSPSKEKAYRYHPYEPVQDSYTQPGRLPNYLSDTKLGKLPPGRRVAYGSNRSRSASPPIQRSHTRVPVLGPLRGPHTSRPAEHPPPEDARLYVNNYVQGSVNEFRPVERRYG